MPFARVTGALDCVAGRAALAHGRALAAADAKGLTAVAGELAELGMKCAAADAAAQAARCSRPPRAQGRGGGHCRAAELAGGASTPALDQVLNPLPLTGRELEIAIMASEGMTNKAIAERLSVSVRTVEGHIYRACMKLDVPDAPCWPKSSPRQKRVADYASHPRDRQARCNSLTFDLRRRSNGYRSALVDQRADPSISELDPLQPIPPTASRPIEFPARDGLTLNFKHLLTRASGAAGEPLLMVAGTGTRANLWNPPTRQPGEATDQERF